MPSGPRIRANNVYGVISDNPLAAAATTFNSVSLPLLPVVASAHAVIVFDPKRVHGDPEIVVVTVHTAASTVATINRGQYGTSQRVHPQGTAWAHVPIDEDYIEILTSGTRPSDPYAGQMIFETDTKKFVGFDGTGWTSRDAGGLMAFVNPITGDTAAVGAAETAVTGLTAIVSLTTSRNLRISAKCNIFSTTAAAVAEDYVILTIKDNAVAIATHTVSRVNSASAQSHVIDHVQAASAGVHTYTVHFQRVGGAGTINSRSSALERATLTIEDIGAA